jgi:hypothetical protein
MTVSFIFVLALLLPAISLMFSGVATCPAYFPSTETRSPEIKPEPNCEIVGPSFYGAYTCMCAF